MEKFAGYGFNKSHSAAYALVAYQTAYLKTHYPVEFMAALLTSETSKPENVVKYIGECKEMGISVEPPDVQVSARSLRRMLRRRGGDSVWAGGGEERGRERDRVDHEGARRRRAGASRASGSSARRSICG
jgi:DNA polymerase III alpha subunit